MSSKPKNISKFLTGLPIRFWGHPTTRSVPHTQLQNFFRSAFFCHKRVVFSLGVDLKPNLNGFIINFSCSKWMVPIWHHFANSFNLIFIILRWNYTFWWKDHVKKAIIKAKSKAAKLYNLQPFKKIYDFSKSMVLISFKVDFEHLFGLSKQLFIDRKLILMGTDVNR